MPRRYTLDDLRTALARDDVRTMADLCRALGLVPRGGNYESVRNFAHDNDVDLEAQLPSPRIRSRRRWREVGDDDIADAMMRAVSLAEAIRLLGFVPSGSTYRRCREVAKLRDLDLSHHTGQGSNIGRRFPQRRKPAADYLRKGVLTPTSKLRVKLIEDGLKEPRCERCDREEWQGQPIPLELDHRDGDRTNNLLENLRLLCPNCHAFTPTYRGRNIGNGRRGGDEPA